VAKGGGDVRATGSDKGTPDVFISYASQDAATAGAIVEILERNGLRCWIAPRDVVPGSLYADDIVGAINEAKVVILVLSEHSLASPHVGKEIERASSKRRRIIVLRTDSEPLTRAFEYFLSESQWVDLGSLGAAAAGAKLVEAIRRHLDHATAGETRVHSDQRAANRAATKPRRRWLATAAIAIVAAIGLTYVLTDKFWLSRHTKAEQAVATVPPNLPAPTIAEKSIAVLPFADMSEKQDQEYFADGLSEELIDMLTNVPELRVPARTSSFYFKGKQATVPEIAKALGVVDVLEGSVRKSGNHLRITAQLVRADNGYHLWSETYDRQLDDIFKVQDEIAGAVVKALKISLLGGSLPEAAGTQNTEAYTLFLQAKAMFRQSHTSAEYDRVVEYLRRAINADPHFANAWALLSHVLSVETAELGRDAPVGQLMEETRRAAEQALKLNSQLADAHLAYARILWRFDLDLLGAEAQIRQALALDPNQSFALERTGAIAAFRGQFSRALELVQQSIMVDPVNASRYDWLSTIYYFAGKYPEAMAANRKALDLDPGTPYYHESAGLILLAQGDPAAALAEIEGDKESRENCSCLVLVYDALRRKAEADAVLADFEKRHALDHPYEIGVAYANRGQLNQAFGWFDRAYRQHDSDLFAIKVDPRAKNVPSDPRSNAFLRKLHLLD
jgi:TolB-like protein